MLEVDKMENCNFVLFNTEPERDVSGFSNLIMSNKCKISAKGPFGLAYRVFIASQTRLDIVTLIAT